MSINRRDFLRRAASVSAAAAIAPAVADAHLAAEAQTATPLPSPGASGIDHIVIVMMENRSFDHLLGWLPGSNGRQAGLVYQDSQGIGHPTQRLTDFVGCAHPDPDHSYTGGRSEVNGGKMDGWLRTTTNDNFCIGYYTEDQLPFLSGFARNFTTLDNYFASILGPTFPNRIFSYAGQTDRLSNTVDLSDLPTIFDSLQHAGVSCKYYFSNVPFLALWGLKYVDISGIYDEFLLDAFFGNLPSVSFLDPKYTILDDGEGNDDHPHADIRAGEAFLSQVYHALSRSPVWKNTVLVVNRDEWGGFYDTVPPPRAAAPNQVDTDLVNGKALLGCRVPVVVASPFSSGTPAKPRINSLVYDHTSVLKLIEWRFGLAPLTRRDASNDVANLAYALDFQNPNFHPPSLPEPSAPAPTPCGLESILPLTAEAAPLTSTQRELAGKDNESYDFYDLLVSERTNGWPIPSTVKPFTRPKS
ncbi:Acid phosphatase [Acidisarcina polymorpha]|uniref:phospholipase C n=1 Tax=Acidisarcina polymorpha TaxID=2211140 RepID=A0A2Z5G3C9_9BACT|nr:alkaline phosphatase family protein [Acidisarcina polymorpha]AXC13703.1 Acid phosphatase [Acidisarcina polymorpha]